MKRLIIAASLLSLLAGGALAQGSADTPPPPPPAAQQGATTNGDQTETAPRRQGPMERRDRERGPRKGRHGMPHAAPSKAAHIRVDLGEGRGINVRCAEEEPMQACADIANALLDRVSQQP